MAASRPKDWTGWITTAFAMDDETWARHANPWSAWTRVPILPLAVIVLLARDELGLLAWLLLGALIVWAWVNPRAFPAPAHLDAWASRAVMGEKLWVERSARPIPPAQAEMARWLTLLQATGVPPLVWGVWAIDVPLALTATALVIVAKFWFLDRMVWLRDETVGSRESRA